MHKEATLKQQTFGKQFRQTLFHHETTEEELLSLISRLNGDKNVHGILCQLPLPESIDEDKVIKAISPQKDVDGFHVENVGALVTGTDGFVSCTPAGIIELLKRSNVEIAGKHCVIVGNWQIAGSLACDYCCRALLFPR